MFFLDMVLDWMHVQVGEYIAIQGEKCDSMFVVLNGRLRAESTQGITKTQLTHDEYGRGATVGDMEALAGRSWSQSVYAIRHVEAARIPIRIINIIMDILPTAGIHFTKVIAENGLDRPMASLPSLLPSYALSLATIAVVPLTDAVDVSDLLALIAPTKLLTKNDTKERVGSHLFKHRNTMLKVKMTRILGDVEESNRLVVYKSDYKYTWWTKLCIQQVISAALIFPFLASHSNILRFSRFVQADCVLILVDS